MTFVSTSVFNLQIIIKLFFSWNIIFFKDFIYLFDRQRSQVGREAGREGGGSRLPAEQRAWGGAQSQDSGIMTWAKGRSWATQGTPKWIFFKDFIYLFDRQRSQVGRETGRERGGSRLPAKQRALCGAPSQDPEIMTWSEGRGFNPLSHTGAPSPQYILS